MDVLRFLWNRARGQPTTLDLRLLDIPITLVVDARREIRRARSVAAEEALLGRVFEALRPEDTVYDVGANIGIIGLLVALHPQGASARIHCFEPEPRNLSALRRNVRANDLEDRIRCHGEALSDSAGRIDLFVRGGPGEGRHSMVAKAGSTASITVPTCTLDEVARESGAAPTVLKIDVEGAEGRVLAGASNSLGSRAVREVFLELHDKGDGDRMPDGESIDDWMQERGYRKVWENDRGRSRHCHYR